MSLSSLALVPLLGEVGTPSPLLGTCVGLHIVVGQQRCSTWPNCLYGLGVGAVSVYYSVRYSNARFIGGK